MNICNEDKLYLIEFLQMSINKLHTQFSKQTEKIENHMSNNC